MEKRKLTIKQKKFADEYIKTGNAYRSAKSAGYSENYAKGNVIRLLENESVKAYVSQKMKEIEDSKIADAKEVLELLTSIARGEVTEKAILLSGNGMQELVPKSADIKDRIRAAELIGRRYALFTDKMEVEGNIGAVIIDDVPDEDE